MKKLLCLMTLFLSGCMAAEHPTPDVYGNEAHRVECSIGFDRACYKKADAVCPSGYYLLDKDLDGGFFASRKSITVRCKGK